MNTPENVDEAIELLQQLGLKEYEARCFVGLNRVDRGTAKQLSEITEVPRTRIYDAIRVLEGKGLVEIHHSSPQEFRAVPLEEAIETLRRQYEARVDRLESTLQTIEIVEAEDETPIQQVWTLSGRHAIEHRTNQLIETASEEVVLVVGDEILLTDDLVDICNAAGREVDVIVGAVDEALQETIGLSIPEATTYVSGLGWLHDGDGQAEIEIGRLLLVDRSTILVSTLHPDAKDEQAIFGDGFGNGLVVIARRLISEGLLTTRDPGEA